MVHTVRWRRWRRRPRPRPRGGEPLAPETEPPSQRGGPPAATSTWSPSFRTRVQNVRFSLGLCTSEPDFHCTKCTFQLRLLHRHTGTGGCAQVFTARRPFSLNFRLFQLGTDPFPLIPTQPESLYTPNYAKAGPGTKRPCETPHRCGPLREVFSGAFLVHTFRRRWRTSRPPKPRRGKRVDPDTQLQSQPGGPSAASCARSPASRRRVQKCPFHVGALHVSPDFALYKNARFSQATCTPPPEPARKSKCSPFPSRRGPISPVSKPFQLWNSPESGGGTKMYASPNPCTPQGHHGRCRRRRALKDPSRMKAPTRPVLKDRSRMNSPTGGYGGGLDCSHSQTALAKGPTAKTTERGKRLDPDTQDPARPGGSPPVPCAGVNAHRQKCHF